MNPKFLFLSRLRNRYLLVMDCMIAGVTPFLAMLVRTESLEMTVELAVPLMLFTAFVVVIKGFIFYTTGLYAQYWPYASDNEVKILLKAMALTLVAEFVIFFMLLVPGHSLPATFPRTIPLIDGILTLLLIGGSRFSIRLLFSLAKKQDRGITLKPILIAGAGIAGIMVARELQRNSYLGLVPIGFVDDDRQKIGKKIHGIPVLGALDQLRTILKTREVAQVVVAMPAVAGSVVRQVVVACKECGVESKTVPGLIEIVRGAARVEQFRNIQLEDLLRRGALKTNPERVARIVQKSCVMVTGAGGSIGSEICRQITSFSPAKIVLIGHGENSVFAIAKELKEHARPGQKILTVIADIRDRHRMNSVFRTHRPAIVFHAAAHKHVGLMEDNIADAVTNNVQGTKNLVELARRYGVERFVMISSDKAVNPTSVMGVTKRVAELIVGEAALQSGKHFVTVRFGNVLGSRGSVVPIFQRQIESGGPITVTDPEVRRYFMTIPEAVQLVLQAGTMGTGGEIFVLDMGEQIRVADLARDMLRLHGLQEGKDVEIKFTGLTPGEKMYEELFFEGDNVQQTMHEKILMCRNSRMVEAPNGFGDPDDVLFAEINTLIEAAQRGERDVILDTLKKLVPQYNPPYPLMPALVVEPTSGLQALKAPTKVAE